MKRTIKQITLAVVLILTGCLTASASPIPEKLDYELSWLGMKIGTSNLRTTINGPDMEIVSKVDSASWTAPFYKVDDIETSKLKHSGKGFVLHQYRMKFSEGKNEWQRVVTVDRKENRFRFNNLLTGERSVQKLVEPAWDPISCLHQIRQMQLKVGETVYLNVFDRNKVNRIKVQVLRREKVTTPAGPCQTIVISTEITIDRQGLYYARGPLTIWLTDDAKKMPVIIEKRIEELFRDGVPDYLQRFTPASVRRNLQRMETIRAVLVGGG